MESYSISLITRMMLLNGQSIKGCCGKITSEYFIFRANRQGRDNYIIVGSHCGRQFLELIDEPLPPLFKAVSHGSEDASNTKSIETSASNKESSDVSEVSNFVKDFTPLNLEFYNALHLLITSWGGACRGQLALMLEYLRKNPTRDTNARYLKIFNNILAKDRQKRGLVAMAASLRVDNPGMTFYEFPLMVEALKREGLELRL